MDPLAGPVVRERLIPLLGELARQIPMSMATFFSTDILQRHSLPRLMLCADLQKSDRLFSALGNL